MAKPIPALAFGDRYAGEPLAYHELLAKREGARGSPGDFDSLLVKRDFSYKTCHLHVNGLAISAFSNTPISADKIQNDVSNLWIYTEGSAEVVARSSKLQVVSGLSGFVSSDDEPHHFLTSTRSAVRVRLDFQKIEAAYAAMTGHQAVKPFKKNSRLVPMQVGAISFSNLFKNLFNQMNDLAVHQTTLELLRLDDSIFRLCALLLSDEQMSAVSRTSDTASQLRKEVTKLCDYLNANLTKPVSLTEMEQVSGLSARVLQYTFRKSFGLSPKEWMRRQRLHAAHAILNSPDQHIKLTSLAYDFCFPNPSVFAQNYRAEFGELPSQTAARKRALILL